MNRIALAPTVPSSASAAPAAGRPAPSLVRPPGNRACALPGVGFLLAACRCLAAVLAATAVGPASATDHSGWFRFAIPWNDSSHNVTDLSATLDAPAGKRGFLEIGADGHFHWSTGARERARFTGFVSIGKGNWPDTAVARGVAARLAKFGVNLVRIHLIDAVDDNGFLAAPTRGTRAIDPEKWGRMDFFLARLREKGIHANLGLHVGRVPVVADGIRAPITNAQAKYVTLFDPDLIALQKEFARTLFEHVNPHTGLAYKEDPAIAFTELTNENSLFTGWLSWGRSGFDSVAAGNPAGMNLPYYRELDTLWNRWLGDKYATDSALAFAWGRGEDGGRNLVANASFEAGTAGWGWWADSAHGASIAVACDTTQAYDGRAALRVDVPTAGIHDYDASVNFGGIGVVRGKSYRLSFRLKADAPDSFQAEFLKEGVWTWYGGTKFAATTAWARYEAFLAASETVTDSLRFNLAFGRWPGIYWIDSVRFAEQDGVGLRPGESMRDASVRRSSRPGLAQLSMPRVRDETAFYLDVEGRYIAEMMRFLRDTLGVRARIAFTNNWYGAASIASQARADYLDTHAYWDHPDYPNGWSTADYTISNRPMTADPARSTLRMLALSRVAGKPFVVSEYNHPNPNSWMSEAPAFLYGYMGFWDADAVLWHAYLEYPQDYRRPWQALFFDNGQNPAMMVQHLLAYPFRAGRIATPSTRAVVDLSREDLLASPRLWGDADPFGDGVLSALRRPFAFGSFDAAASTPPEALQAPHGAIRSESGEIEWLPADTLLRVDNPHWQGIVGKIDKAGARVSRLGLEGARTTGERDFAAVHLLSTDSLPIERSRRLVLIAAARVENAGTLWNAGGTRVTRQMLGADTALCEPVTGVAVARVGAVDSVSVWELDARGERVRALPVGWSADTLRFELTGRTLWYELARHDGSSPRLAAMPMRRFAAIVRFALRERSAGRLQLEWHLPDGFAGGSMAATVFDAAGRKTGQWSSPATVSGHVEFPAMGRGVHFVHAEAVAADGTKLEEHLRQVVVR